MKNKEPEMRKKKKTMKNYSEKLLMQVKKKILATIMLLTKKSKMKLDTLLRRKNMRNITEHQHPVNTNKTIIMHLLTINSNNSKFKKS